MLSVSARAAAGDRPTSPTPPPGGPLRALARAYRDLERTTWGWLLLANIWPAYLMALTLMAKLGGLYNRLSDPAAHGALQDPLRYQAEIAQEVVTYLFVTIIVVLFVIRRPVIGRRADVRGALVALAGTLILSAVAFTPVPRETSTPALLASTALVLLGTALTIWSLATLGRCFGVFPEARGLVTRGPYRFVRHPVYLWEMVSGLAWLIVKPHVVVVALYVAFVALQYWRAVLEERALAEAFPEEYAAYRARTGRLLPRLR